MKTNKLSFISFEPRDGTFITYIPMEEMFSSGKDLEVVLQEAIRIYEGSLADMRTLLIEIDNYRRDRKQIPARNIWQLGNAVFQLSDTLKELSLQLDGLYDHLSRDLHVKRKWLEKVIIFRRYLPKEEIIGDKLNWGLFEKGTRRAALKLLRGS